MTESEFLKHIGKKIQQQRRAQGMTAKQLGVKISVWQHCISDIELGKRNAGILQYKKIATVLGLDIKHLLP